MCKHQKFDLVHQTISPRERVGSGNETKVCEMKKVESLPHKCNGKCVRSHTGFACACTCVSVSLSLTYYNISSICG